MAREFFAQAFMRRPVVALRRKAQFFRRLGRRRTASIWPLSRSRALRCGAAQDRVGGFHQLAAVAVERVEGARAHQAFEGALVDQLADPRGARNRRGC